MEVSSPASGGARAPGGQLLDRALPHVALGDRGAVAAASCLGRRLQPVLRGLEVRQQQLGLDRLEILHGVDGAVRVRHLRMLERAHDVHHGVHLADVAEEAIAETLPLVGAAHEPGDVDDVEVLGDQPLDRQRLAQPLQSLVRDRHDRDVRVHGREGILGRLRAPAGERVEERRLAGVRQPDDPDLHRRLAITRPSAVPTTAPATTSDG